MDETKEQRYSQGSWFMRGALVLSVLLVVSGAVACSATSPSGQVGEATSETLSVEASPTSGDQSVNAPEVIDVRARLVFPERTDLTFERAGEVEEITVSPGDRVTEGQVLARLNSEHFPALEEEVVRLNYQIAQARENIKMINLDYSAEPLLAAQREETVARLELANVQAEDFFDDIDQNHEDSLTAATSELDQARNALEVAEDDLAEVERDLEADHILVLAAAEQAEADAELALDRAIERLADYKEDFGDDEIRASDRISVGKVAVDQAIERLDDYKEDLQQDIIRASDRVTEAELALDTAQDTLDDFLSEHERRIIRARTVVGAADDAVDAAQRPLTQFLREPIRDLQADGKPVDVAKLESLQAALDLAESNLDQAREDLVELEEGPDPFRVHELESNVAVAELNLSQARDDLKELEEGPDPILLQELESSVKVAELNLSGAREDLSDLEEGPDLIVLNQLQSQVDLARVNLSQARKRLSEELEGPDPLIVPRLELNITLAQRRLELAERRVQDLLEDGPSRESIPLMEQEIATRLTQIDQLYEGPDALQLAQIESLNASISLALDRIGDIEEEMDEYVLRAPFDGVIYLVNVEVDDMVNKHSRVAELIDPSNVVIEGYVDATEVGRVVPGSIARVTIDSAPGGELSGTVFYVAADPRTERGVISYSIHIQVDLPAGVEIPFSLSAVDAVIYP